MQPGATLADALRRPEVASSDVLDRFPAETGVETVRRVEIELKMDGYVRRAQAAIERAARDEAVALPGDLDYAADSRALARSAREARPDAPAHAGRGDAHPRHHAHRRRAGERSRQSPESRRDRRPGVKLPLPDPDARTALHAGGVEEPLAERLAIFAALVLSANRRVNLTGSKTGAAFAEHILDALTLRGDVTGRLVDVGSGNGIPGIPLALAAGISVTLIEPIKKRATFLSAALDALGLDGEVVAARAEEAAHDPAYREQYDRATARAVASGPAVAELTVPFLAVGGRALLQRGALGAAERNAVADAALVLGARLLEERELGGERRVLVLEKRSATGPASPARTGRRPSARSACARPREGFTMNEVFAAQRFHRETLRDKKIAARTRYTRASVRHPLDDVLIAALPQAAVYAVGGRVRDEFRQRLEDGERPPKDLDYVVTGIPAEALLAALQRAGPGRRRRRLLCRAQVPPPGRGSRYRAAAARALHRGRPQGVRGRSRPRGSLGGRSAAARLPHEHDRAAARGRRDRRPLRRVADIRAGRIDIVAEAAFSDDPLRMLRAAQFAARFGYRLTERTSAAMAPPPR